MTETSFSDTTECGPARIDAIASLPPLLVRYEHDPLPRVLADPHVIAVVGFGSAAPAADTDPRYLHLPLEPAENAVPFEVWRGAAPIRSGRDGHVRWNSNGDYAVGALEIDEAEHGGIASAARHAYNELAAWIAGAPTPHVLRIWNYLDAINDGAGDAERYREFCRGRAEGMRSAFADGYPAATAIGVRDGRRRLRVYWIAARQRGTALENPRQISAWRYPRQYGPSAPTFARAMHAPTARPQLYISGTAAIVGHASHHVDDLAAQVDETLANFGSLMEAAGVPPALHYGAGCVLKIYVRRAEDVGRVRTLLDRRLPPATALLLLHGDICRRELLIEIDGIQGA